MSSLSFGWWFSQAKSGRLGRLLPVEVTPGEWGHELKMRLSRLCRHFVPARYPHRPDEKDQLSIAGRAFRRWYESMQEARRPPMADHEARRHPMADDEPRSLRCRRAVPLIGLLNVITRSRRGWGRCR